MTTADQTDIEAAEQTDTPDTPDTPDDNTQTADTTDEAETFPREYVVKLRDENAKYRQRAGQSDDLAKRLHLELVKATGRLADPTDLPFDEGHIVDAAQMVESIDTLLAAKPHLANRRPTGDIGQGASAASDSFSLSGLLRGNAS